MRYVNEKNIRTLLILVAGFIIFASADFAAAQTTKTNDDRKTECTNNLSGKVVNYGDGGFACVAKDATIFCTSGGQCACFGDDCGKLGGGGALGRIADSRKKLIAGFQKNLTKQQKSAMGKAIDESFAALRKGDGKTAVKKIEEISALRMNDNGGGESANGLECRDKCQHHLDDGNAPAYAVCWWTCWVTRIDKQGRVDKDVLKNRF